jgi:FtsP/CotA-like multicopper oxidase with cupredoxin domain
VLRNNSGGWQHPIHIHFEEFQILSRNGQPAKGVERSRKDVVRLGFNEEITVFMRFRDFVGRYPLHCHNTVHEDHAMMLRWEIDEIGDRNTEP